MYLTVYPKTSLVPETKRHRDNINIFYGLFYVFIFNSFFYSERAFYFYPQKTKSSLQEYFLIKLSNLKLK